MSKGKTDRKALFNPIKESESSRLPIKTSKPYGCIGMPKYGVIESINWGRGVVVKVFIVDDSEVVRERLRAILFDLKEIEIIGQAQDPFEAINSIRKLKPDAVILDLQMPGGSGFEVLVDIKKDHAAPTFIILTNYPYAPYRKKCMEAGADFFFDKSTEFERVPEVFKRLIQNHGLKAK